MNIIDHWHKYKIIFIVTPLMLASCSDDDETDSTSNVDETSYYNINIEDKGNFNEEGLSVSDPEGTIISATWQENPNYNTEKILCSFNSEELFFEASIMLENANALNIGDCIEINQNDATTSSFTLILDQPQDENQSYCSMSGSVIIENLEIGPLQTNPIDGGNSSFANFTMNFSGDFDTTDPTTLETSTKQISGEIKVFVAPIN
ncbi:MAG: hypothetical protein GVY05_00415 [Bacteroidetes bacterium]|jgi:hypothetical protein|nr:hypothetical protein [Bacteroidota bacterium]